MTPVAPFTHQTASMFEPETSNNTQSIRFEPPTIQATRHVLDKTIKALSTLKQSEEDIETIIQAIKKNTEKIQFELQETNKLQKAITIESKKHSTETKEEKTTTNEKEKYISNINKINSTILNLRTNLRKLESEKIELEKSKKEIELNETIKENENKEKKKTIKTIEEKNYKNTKTKEYTKETIGTIGKIREFKGLIKITTNPTLQELRFTTEKIKNKQRAKEITSEFTSEITSTITNELIKKIADQRTNRTQENIKKNLTSSLEKLTISLQKISKGQLEFPKIRVINSFIHAGIAAVTLAGTFAFIDKFIANEDENNDENNGLSRKALATTSILSTLFISLSEVYITHKNCSVSINNLKKEGEKQIEFLSKFFNEEIKNTAKELNNKKEKKLEINNLIKMTTNEIRNIEKLRKEKFIKETEQIDIETKENNKKISDLKKSERVLEIELKTIQLQKKKTNNSISEKSYSIASFNEKILENEKTLMRIHEKEKHLACEEISEINKQWTIRKHLQSQIDECEMKKETLQSKLLSLSLNLQEHETHLKEKQETVLKLMAEIESHRIADHFLVPNMTEHAFERLIQRHHNIELKQLRQRVEKGRFKNSEGVTIQAAAKQASTYNTFYHLLYATIDAIDFIEKNRHFSPRTNYNIEHAINVGIMHAEGMSLKQKKHSVVSYIPKIDPVTGHQKMLIEHMY